MSCKLLGLLLTLLLALTGSMVTAPAQAAPVSAVTQTRVVYGDRTLSLTWANVPGATRYRVQYATVSSFKHAGITAYTSAPEISIRKLANGKRYYLRVLSNVGDAFSVSKTFTAIPQAGYPSVMPEVTVKPGQNPDQIDVTWTKLQRATRVILLAGSDNQQRGAYFHSAWLPATTTHATLTIPQKYRWLIGSGTGNPIYVKVAQYNDATATKILRARSDTASYRLSLAGSYGFATPLPVKGSTGLRAASYNIQSVTASPPGHPWSARMPKVINNIIAADADLIGLQEDDAAQSMNYQHRQVAAALAPHGYMMSGDLPATYRYNMDVTDGWFYYKPTILNRLDGGIVSPRDDLNLGWPTQLKDTRGTWAKFQVRATGQIIYVLNIHLPATGSAGVGVNALIDLRMREIQALSMYIQARAGNNPVILLGDLNSAVFRDGYSAPAKLHDLGWYDTAAAQNRVNADMLTVNAPIPYPTGKPYRAPNVTTGRIDYIFTRNMGGATRYTNQVLLNADGTINLDYQGSDHNLQLATLMF